MDLVVSLFVSVIKIIQCHVTQWMETATVIPGGLGKSVHYVSVFQIIIIIIIIIIGRLRITFTANGRSEIRVHVCVKKFNFFFFFSFFFLY